MFLRAQQEYSTNHYLEDILKQVNIGTWEWDLRTDDVTWSENMSRFVGKAPARGEIKTSRKQCIVPIHKDDLASVEKEINSCIRDHKNLKVEYRVVWPDHSIHWVQSRGHVIYSENNVPSQMFGIMFDITERKSMEQALQKANEQAARQNKAKSDFLSSMSHELRNPLNAVIGFSQIMSGDSNLTDEQIEYLDIIKRSGEHLISLIGEILDLAKIEAGKVDLTIEHLPLKDLLSECMELISVTAKEQKQNLSIELGECDNQYIYVDKKRFTQVMLNLLSNAVKYGPPHGDIHVSCEQTGDKVCIRVKDNGPGLSVEQQNKLFQPFERLGAEGTDIPGSGMGLVITMQLVELMHGRIGVESEPGSGSVFWIQCPCAEIDC